MLTQTQLMLEFESLGDNTEFGLVQRLFGADPMSLLRWSRADSLETLLGALDARFDGLGAPGNVELKLFSRWPNYVLIDKRFGFQFHTDNAPEPGRDINDDPKRLEWVSRPLRELTDRLLGRLAAAEKVFVYRRKQPPDAAEIARLFAALRRYAADNALLWVTEGPQENWGKVKLATPGLALAYIDRLADDEPPRVSTELWLEICTTAFARLRDGRPRQTAPEPPAWPVLFKSRLLGHWQR